MMLSILVGRKKHQNSNGRKQKTLQQSIKIDSFMGEDG
jgi:hypothetical protein